MKIERSLLLVSLLPLSLGLGSWAALGTLTTVIGGIFATDQILSHDEKHRLLAVWDRYVNHFRKFRSGRSTKSNLAATSNNEFLIESEIQTMNLHENLSTSLPPIDSLVFETDPWPLPVRPLRVMFCTTSMHIGGAETLLFNLLNRLDRSRFAPELCCLKEQGELGDQLSRKIPVHANLLRHKFDLRVLRRLTQLLRERQIDALVTVGSGDKMFWGRLAARRAGVPVIISALHSTGWPDGITFLNRRLSRLTDAFVAVANNHARHLIKAEQLPSGRVCMIPNGIDTEKYRPLSVDHNIRQQLSIPRTRALGRHCRGAPTGKKS